MIETKLILIEGIAGSGKSTTGQKLYDLISANGYAAEFYHEFTKSHPVNIYQSPETSQWINETKSNWIKFTNKTIQTDKIVILEATIFQWIVGELLERNIDEKFIYNYVTDLFNIIKALNPVMIYFYQDNITAAIEKIYNQRKENWQNKVATYLENLDFGKNRNLNGLELYLELNRAIRKSCDNLFEILKIKKLSIENSNGEWKLYLKQIYNFLELP